MRHHLLIRLYLCLALVIVTSSLSLGQEKAPERGFRPGGSYAISDIETISTTSGNMMLKVPLAALPPGRGGLSASLNLIYNSKLYDSFPSSAYINHSYYDVTNLKKSQAGGWRYGYKYELYGEARYGGVDEMGEVNPCSSTPHIAKLALLTPDGGKHELRLTGHTDGDGFHDVWRDGSPACWGGYGGVSTTLNYYTTDGTFLRLEVQHDSDSNQLNNPWTLYLPDGGRVTGGNSPQRIYDRNNNYIEIVNGTYGGHTATYLNDQVGRSIIIEYESATNQDTIRVVGYNGAALTTTVAWTDVVVHKAYTREVGTPFNLPATWRSVSQITLPSQAGSLSYIFGYNANGSNPTVGWGELNSITLPSGAKSTYTYVYDNQNNIYSDLVLLNRPSQKQLVYRPEYDGTIVSNTPCTPPGCITETWSYGMEYVNLGDGPIPISSTISGPNGGVSTEYFNKKEDGAVDQSNSGLVYKSVGPDGSVTERYWQANIPYGTPVFSETSYPKYEFTSIPNASGTLTQTSIRENSYDKNGNVTRVAAFDWVPYANVPRNGQGRPYAPPSGVQPKTITVNTYFNPTPDASNSTTNDPDAFQMAGSPRLHRLLESSEVRDGSNAVLSRTEISYDNTSATGVVSYPIGNPTLQKRWDSTKGALPLGSGNNVSTSTQYDSYGNPTLTTDARGVTTSYCYSTGDCTVAGQTANLYPTRIKVAANYPALTLTTTKEYDFNTGVVKVAKDVDNDVSTVTSYDPLGRPTLVENADGKTEETKTVTDYSDAYRRVIVRSDLNTLGDGKLISIQHYDQLGRIRLTRQLENAATESETDETMGIKVQTRYLTSGSYTYLLSSNPYRANYSYNAGSETTMGWARTKVDVGGRVVEMQTFGGASLPAPWGSNTTSTGTVTTAYDAQFTTVTDQAGKVRRSMTNGLGQLARIDEPTTSGLGLTSSPNQPTSYTYDALSNLVKVEQGSQYRYFIYDSLSRLRRARNPEQDIYSSLNLSDPVTGNSQWSMAYQYDDNGNLTQKTDARGVVSTFVYDALNRNTTVDYSDTVGINPDITRVYDGATNGKGRFWYSYAGGSYSVGSTVEHTAIDSYDALGRPGIQRQVFKQSSVWGPTYQVSRSYNRASGVTSQIYPSGRTVNYAYDNAGRTSSFTGNLGDGTNRTYATVTLYSPWGGLSREQFGTDIPLYHKQYYTNRGQFCDTRVSTVNDDWNWNRGAIVNYYSLANFSQCGTGTDTNGNLYIQQHFVPHNDQMSASTVHQQNYDYDSLNRLTWAGEYLNSATNTGSQHYQYDRWGNRKINPITWGTGINNKQFDVNTANNRLGVPSGQSGTLSYDSAGNLTTDSYSGAGSRVYDAENRMTKAWGGNNQWQEYTYNADGQRVRRKVEGTETWQVYGMDGELLAEYSQNGAPAYPKKEYGYRNGQLLVTAEVMNVATAANGGTATASSTLSPYVPSYTNDGSRRAINSTIWLDSTFASFPDWVQVDFNGSKTIHEIDVITQQDNYQNPVEPTLTQTFNSNGITAFDVQYWNGSGWVNVSGGSVTGNNKVWRRFTFSPITTTKIRVLVNAGFDNAYSRVVEVEAWGSAANSGPINWLVSDHLGTPRMIFDKSGSLANVKRHDYLPFGEELFSGVGGRTTQNGYASDTVRQKFTSKERDNETSLDYFGARYYGSTQGRFTSPDNFLNDTHVDDPASWNLYAYVRSNPLRYIDPAGEEVYSTNLTDEQKKKLIEDWQKKTGYKSISFDKNNKLAIDTQAGFQGGSAKARDQLSAAVNSTDIRFNLKAVDTTKVAFGEVDGGSTVVNYQTKATRTDYTVSIDFGDFSRAGGDDSAKEAYSVGLVAIHEFDHRIYNASDYPNSATDPGPLERTYINPIRRELGLAERVNYTSRPVDAAFKSFYPGGGQQINFKLNGKDKVIRWRNDLVGGKIKD